MQRCPYVSVSKSNRQSSINLFLYHKLCLFFQNQHFFDTFSKILSAHLLNKKKFNHVNYLKSNQKIKFGDYKLKPITSKP